VWTQLKINEFYEMQSKAVLENKFDKLDSNYEKLNKKAKKRIK
jgi:hypothetical protein